MRDRIRILILVAIVLGLSAQAQTSLRFAQMTDFHLFDAGYNCYQPDVEIERIDNLDAIKWAIEKVNQENRRKPIDFVVITGDFGIVNSIIPGRYSPTRDRPSRNGCNSKTAETSRFGPVESLTVAEAAKTLAIILHDLDVKPIYLVPGNNDVRYNSDLKIEDPNDRELYKAFVDVLSDQMRGRIRDLSGEANVAWNAPADIVRGYSLIGMDTASFKSTDDEGEKAAPLLVGAEYAPTTSSSAWPECPAPYPHSLVAESRENELKRVAGITARITRPFLLFTHVPDRQDPYEGRQKNTRTHCRFLSSWFIDYQAQGSWRDILMNPNLVAVFAGHFHDSDVANYGGPFRAATVPSAGEVYIAPPLAKKNQWLTESKRGLLMVEVRVRDVKTAIEWFPNEKPGRVVTEHRNRPPPPSLASLRRWLIGYGIFGLFILVWDVSLVVKGTNRS